VSAGVRIVTPIVGLAVILLVSSPWSMEVLPLLWFVAAATVLDLFDLWLPEGDSLSMDAAVLAAAVVLFGPETALAASLLGRGIAHLVRYRSSGSRRLFSHWATAVVGISVASVANATLLSMGQAGLSTPVGRAITVSLVLTVTQLMYSQLVTSSCRDRRFWGLVGGNLRLQGPLLLAQVSISALTVMISQVGSGAVYWVLPVVVFVLLLMRQSYASLMEIRSAYRSTVEVLAQAAEFADEQLAGHAVRTGSLAREIADALGVSGAELERLSYAALLHDVDLVGVDPDSEGRIERRSGEMFKDVRFLEEVVPVLRVCDGDRVAAASAGENELMMAFIVALASDIDMRGRCPARYGEAVCRVSPWVPPRVKAKVLNVAVSMGHPVPAVE